MSQMDKDRFWVVMHADYACRFGELDETLSRDQIRELAHLCNVRDRQQAALRKMCLRELAKQAVKLLTGVKANVK